ncbi:MAG: hypothetical protein ABI183_27265 [Polyangiaceae bacterium]
MTRSFSSPMFTRAVTAFAVFGLGIAMLPAAACKSTGVGDPCTPEAEYNTSGNGSDGFSIDEVNFESKSFQCLTRLCLVNHFQGRVSCQYGQDSSGNPPPGVKNGCTVPNDATQKITGDPSLGAKNVVNPQCTDRTADKAVYCSCRCANADGKTDDGANYCACPDGFTCSQLVSPIGTTNEGLTGAFCIKQGTEYDKSNACANTCDPTTNPCPGPQE